MSEQDESAVASPEDDETFRYAVMRARSAANPSVERTRWRREAAERING